MSILAEFFQNEFNGYVAGVLEEKLAERKAAYLTFNIFNVRLEPELGVATIEDELDPERYATVPLADFVRMVEAARST